MGFVCFALHVGCLKVCDMLLQSPKGPFWPVGNDRLAQRPLPWSHGDFLLSNIVQGPPAGQRVKDCWSLPGPGPGHHVLSMCRSCAFALAVAVPNVSVCVFVCDTYLTSSSTIRLLSASVCLLTCVSAHRSLFCTPLRFNRQKDI